MRNTLEEVEEFLDLEDIPRIKDEKELDIIERLRLLIRESQKDINGVRNVNSDYHILSFFDAEDILSHFDEDDLLREMSYEDIVDFLRQRGYIVTKVRNTFVHQSELKDDEISDMITTCAKELSPHRFAVMTKEDIKKEICDFIDNNFN